MASQLANLMKKIELQRSKLRELIQSSADLTRQDVVQLSQDLDLLILEAQALLASDSHNEEAFRSRKPYVRAI